MSNTGFTVLVVRSATNAMRGQQILENHGITAYVQRNTSPNSKQGCGYALKVKGNTDTAMNLLHNAGVDVVSVQEG